MELLRKMFGLGPKVNCQELVENGAVLIDVRTPAEFDNGHVKGAKNVPLNTIRQKAKKIQELKKPIVLCCVSGIRSGRATKMLKREGLQEVYNGGPWNNFQ